MVEASLVYPIIVFTTVLVIAVSVYVWINVSNAVDMEMETRRIAGEDAGTVIYNTSSVGSADGGPAYVVYDYPIPNYYVSDYGVEMRRNMLVKKVRARGSFSYENDVMFNIFSRNDYSLQSSAINEVSIIWDKQLVSDIISQ